jgi:hypothetical protein
MDQSEAVDRAAEGRAKPHGAKCDPVNPVAILVRRLALSGLILKQGEDLDVCCLAGRAVARNELVLQLPLRLLRRTAKPTPAPISHEDN